MTTAAEDFTRTDTGKSTGRAEGACDTTTPAVRVHVSELLQGGREAILVHGGSDYRLRITANGKLILTK